MLTLSVLVESQSSFGDNFFRQTARLDAFANSWLVQLEYRMFSRKQVSREIIS